MHSKALFFSNADNVVVTIGSSNANTKTGSDPGGYACSKFVSITNWAGTDTYPDTFAVTQSGTSLSVKRTDAPGAGWGMNLRFYCTRAVLVHISNSHANTKTVNRGYSG